MTAPPQLVDVAKHADIALQDALVGFGHDCHYDAAKFLASMRGNGYEIRRAEQDDGWQTIETAPKDGTHFLVGCFDGGTGFGWPAGKHQATQTVAHWFNDGVYVSVYGGEEAQPQKWTHWRPLPTSPKVK